MHVSRPFISQLTCLVGINPSSIQTLTTDYHNSNLEPTLYNLKIEALKVFASSIPSTRRTSLLNISCDHVAVDFKKTISAAKMALKQPAVLYHYPCPDGAFAALAAHMFFSESSVPALFFPNSVYSPIRVEELPVDQISDAYLLDFVGPPGFVQQLSPKVDRVIILDHHKTALKMLEDGEFDNENVTKVIDMGRSGATIAYDYFKEKISALAKGNNMSGLHKFERSRRLFEYIEDADLWHWCLHNSKAFSSGLKDSNIEFSLTLNPSLFQQLLSLDVEHVINQGVSSLAHKQTLINEVLDQSYEIVLDDGSYCLAVNADAVSDLRSELGHQLAEKSRDHNLRGIGAVVYRVPELKDDQILKISLRSIDNEDTTLISQKHGGGGHRNASSFMLSCQEFEQWKVGCAANGA